MQSRCSFICMALAAMAVCVRSQTSYFRRTYYSPVAAPSTHYYQHNHPLLSPAAAAYGGGSIDLASEESKLRDASPKRYSKKSSYHPYGSEEDEVSSERYSSGEYSNEAKENDSREYTIGTQIRVQHPITITKKPSHNKAKYLNPSTYKTVHGNYATSGGDLNLSAERHELRPLPPKKHTRTKYTDLFDSDPIHVVAPPKHIVPSALASSSYSVYEPEEHEYDVAASPSTRAKAQLLDRFKGVASKKQIEKYLEDQQKLLDEALKLQLLSNPKFKKLLKSKGQDYFEEQQYEHELPPEPLNYRSHFESSRPRRRPHTGDHRSPPKIHKSSAGLSSKPRRFRSALIINV